MLLLLFWTDTKLGNIHSKLALYHSNYLKINWCPKNEIKICIKNVKCVKNVKCIKNVKCVKNASS
jgi:hypothetical protein